MISRYCWTVPLMLILTATILPIPLQSDDASAITSTAETVVNPETGIITPVNVAVKVYYFHGNRRCKTCLAIESKSKVVLEKVFPEQMATGLITWQAVNTDLKENERFVTAYDLMFGSLIISKLENGRETSWKNLQKVWELVWNDTAFTDYIQKEVSAYLEK